MDKWPSKYGQNASWYCRSAFGSGVESTVGANNKVATSHWKKTGTDMEKPIHQQIITYSARVVAGLLALGAFLDAIGSALDLVTPVVAFTGTLLIGIVWYGAQNLLKRHPLSWVTKDHSKVYITGLNKEMKWALAGMVVLLWIPCLVNLFNALKPKSLAFPPANRNETLIVIATFHRTDGVTDTGIHNEIHRAIDKAATQADITDLRVEVEPVKLEAEDWVGAEVLGKRYNAGMVIWGSDTGVRVQVNYLNLKQPSFIASEMSISESNRTQMARPDAYATFVTQDLPAQLTFLSLFAIGQSYYSQERFDEAINALKEGIASLPSSNTPFEGESEAYSRLGWLHQLKGDSRQAILYHNTAVELDPNNPDHYADRGDAYNGMGDFEKAIEDFTTAIELDPSEMWPYQGRAWAYRRTGDYKNAIEDYTAAIELDPDNPYFYQSRGDIYHESGDYEKAKEDYMTAIEHYSTAIKLNQSRQNRASLLLGRGGTFRRLGDFEKAIDDFTTATKLDRDNPDPYAERAWTYSLAGNHKKATADYTAAVELAPNDPWFYLQRGWTYLDSGDYENAIEDLTAAMRLDPNNPDLYAERAQAHSLAGNYEKAIADYEECLDLISADDSRRENILEAIKELKSRIEAE